MQNKIKTDLNYYKFLDMVQDVCRNSKSFQSKVIKRVYENFDVYQLKYKLDKQIEYIDNLLSSNK